MSSPLLVSPRPLSMIVSEQQRKGSEPTGEKPMELSTTAHITKSIHFMEEERDERGMDILQKAIAQNRVRGKGLLTRTEPTPGVGVVES